MDQSRYCPAWTAGMRLKRFVFFSEGVEIELRIGYPEGFAVRSGGIPWRHFSCCMEYPVLKYDNQFVITVKMHIEVFKMQEESVPHVVLKNFYRAVKVIFIHADFIQIEYEKSPHSWDNIQFFENGRVFLAYINRYSVIIIHDDPPMYPRSNLMRMRRQGPWYCYFRSICIICGGRNDYL